MDTSEVIRHMVDDIIADRGNNAIEKFNYIVSDKMVDAVESRKYEIARTIANNESVLDEISLRPKIKAYARRSDNEHEAGHYGNDEEMEKEGDKAEKIMSNIKRKHGDVAAQHAERAATSKIIGRRHMQPVEK